MFSICRKMVLITKELSPLGVPLNRELLEVVKKIKAKKVKIGMDWVPENSELKLNKLGFLHFWPV